MPVDTSSVKTKAATRVESKAADVRHKLGERVFKWTTEAFEEQYQAQRRADATKAFGAGVVVGVVASRIARR